MTVTTLLAADLILTMTRKQRSEVVGLAPATVRRVFTLPGFARLLSQLRLDDLPSGSLPERLAAAVRAVGARRSPGTTDDIDDPYGRSEADYTRAFAEIEGAAAPCGIGSRLLRVCGSGGIDAAVVGNIRPTRKGLARSALQGQCAIRGEPPYVLSDRPLLRQCLRVGWDCCSWVLATFAVLASRYDFVQVDQSLAVLGYAVAACLCQVVVGAGFKLYRGRYKTATFERASAWPLPHWSWPAY